VGNAEEEERVGASAADNLIYRAVVAIIIVSTTIAPRLLPLPSLLKNNGFCCLSDHAQARLRHGDQRQGEQHLLESGRATCMVTRMGTLTRHHRTALPQPPVQLNSLTGTYATSTYLAALKKSPKELDALVKDISALEKKFKDDVKISQFLSG
jgi:hypothetical protein